MPADRDPTVPENIRLYFQRNCGAIIRIQIDVKKVDPVSALKQANARMCIRKIASFSYCESSLFSCVEDAGLSNRFFFCSDCFKEPKISTTLLGLKYWNA